MKQKRFSDEQIIGILKEADAGAVVLRLCRKHGMSSAIFYYYSSTRGKCGLRFGSGLFDSLDDKIKAARRHMKTTSRPFGHAFNSSRWLTVLGIGVALGVLVLGTVTMVGIRDDTWTQAQQSAGNLLLALERDIARNVSVLDLSLLGVMEAMDVPGFDQVSPAIQQHAMFDRSATADDLGSILVLDSAGKVVADSTSLKPNQLDLADHDYFKVHQQRGATGLFVSRVFPSRQTDGDLLFAISRRIDKPDGEFAGVVLATLRLVYLRRLFEKLELGSKGTITLLRADGRMLFRYPFRPQDVDLDLSENPNFFRFRTAQSGQYTAVAGIDGVERLYTFRHLGALPLILSVSLSTDEILEPWRRKTMVIGPAVVLLCGFAVLSALLFRREMIRRTRSESVLAELAEQLRIQALTDGLTGLLNRRAFDVELTRAFGSAVRRGTTLAMLLVDADYFKRFNDTYGHIAGDDVLRAIASCVRSHLRRPYDTGARYGGEEFVVTLPDTDETAANMIAARIRDSVRDLKIQHSDSPIGSVTISVGVAAATPAVGDDPANLLRRADQGLYAAKQAGRDSVRCIPQHQNSTAKLFKLNKVSRDNATDMPVTN